MRNAIAVLRKPVWFQ